MDRVGKCMVGLGCLISLGCGQRRADEETRSQPVRDAVQETVQSAKDKAQELKERLPEAREHVRDALQDAKEKAQELKEQLPPAEEVKEGLREATEKLKAAGATIEREALQAREKIRERVRDEH